MGVNFEGGMSHNFCLEYLHCKCKGSILHWQCMHFPLRVLSFQAGRVNQIEALFQACNERAWDTETGVL